MKILVTGATGALGSRVIETLLKTVPASELVAFDRSLERTDKLRSLGVEVRVGDFDDPASLDKAFEGIDRLLVISTREPNDEKRIHQHVNAVEAAKRANIQLIAYTSGAKGSESPIPLMTAHKDTEKAILESGVPYTILRNNLYIETEMNTIKASMMGAPIVTSSGSGKIGFALRNDYADAAAAVLAGEGHENKVYELAGKLVTNDDLAVEIGKVIGKEVLVKHVDDAGYAAYLKDLGVPEIMIPMSVGTKAGIREGYAEVGSNDLEMLLGRSVTPINEEIAHIVSEISQEKN